MSWNYRVLRRKYKSNTGEDLEVYNIHEVYYDDNDNPTSSTVEPMYPQGETRDELIADIDHMRRAYLMPVLDYESFGVEKGPEIVKNNKHLYKRS